MRCNLILAENQNHKSLVLTNQKICKMNYLHRNCPLFAKIKKTIFSTI